MGKKIGLMGGTFDPVHAGHLRLASLAMEEFSLDGIWFMPTGNSYHKKASAATTAQRVFMVRLAIAPYEKFSLCDCEIKRPGPTYTADTLDLLSREYPEDTFFFLCGADSLLYMDRWMRPDDIFKKAVIVAAEREPAEPFEIEEKIRSLTESFHADIRLLKGKIPPVSSSGIRRKIQSGADFSDDVPDDVACYIRENGLYREKESD